jgi:hypothetical protein
MTSQLLYFSSLSVPLKIVSRATSCRRHLNPLFLWLSTEQSFQSRPSREGTQSGHVTVWCPLRHAPSPSAVQTCSSL